MHVSAVGNALLSRMEGLEPCLLSMKDEENTLFHPTALTCIIYGLFRLKGEFVEVVKITASIAAAKDAPPKTLRQSRSAKDARETLLKAIPQRAYTHTHK